jgi:hypothetical protein
MFTENLSAFFADFGVTVTIKRGVTVLRTITAIFTSAAQELAVYDRSFYDEKFYSAKVSLTNPLLECQTVDVADTRLNDTCTVNGVDYYVRHGEADGTGISLLFLSLDQV